MPILALLLLLTPAACSYPTGETPYPGRMRPAALDRVRSAAERRGGTDRRHLSPHLRRLSRSRHRQVGQHPADLRLLLGPRQLRRRPDRKDGRHASDPRAGGRLGYSLHLRPALSSLSGCPGTSEDIEFITGPGPAGGTPTAAGRIRCRSADLHHPLRGRRVSPGGRERRRRLPAAPAAGLSLCAPESWDQLVAVPSRQDDRLQRVEAGDSARSYLLRKLLPRHPLGRPDHRRLRPARAPGRTAARKTSCRPSPAGSTAARCARAG